MQGKSGITLNLNGACSEEAIIPLPKLISHPCRDPKHENNVHALVHLKFKASFKSTLTCQSQHTILKVSLTVHHKFQCHMQNQRQIESEFCFHPQLKTTILSAWFIKKSEKRPNKTILRPTQFVASYIPCMHESLWIV